MLIKVLDYAGSRSSTGSVIGYLANKSVDPFMRECLERAEDLLEHVRRNREGEGDNSYERACRAKIDVLFGRHDQALDLL